MSVQADELVYTVSNIVEQNLLIFFFFPFVLQGRPKGVTPKYSLKPLVPRLSELLGVSVSLML